MSGQVRWIDRMRVGNHDNAVSGHRHTERLLPEENTYLQRGGWGGAQERPATGLKREWSIAHAEYLKTREFFSFQFKPVRGIVL